VRDDQSFFQRVQTIDAEGQRWMLLDGLVHTHVLLQSDDPVRCEYARAAELVPALRPDARRFLVIGCGGGAMLRLLQAEGRTFDVVELDEAVLRAAREDFGAAVPGAVFNAGDGRAFLRGGGGAWDAALVDVVSTETMPEHLSTAEFFRELRRALRPGGVALFNSIGAPGGTALASFGRTLAAAFARVRGFTAHLEPDSTNVVWLASDGPLDLPDPLREAWEPRAYDPGPAGIVLTDDLNPVNAWNAELGLTFRRRLQDWLGPGLAAAR
jgi:spermidine synthase